MSYLNCTISTWRKFLVTSKICLFVGVSFVVIIVVCGVHLDLSVQTLDDLSLVGILYENLGQHLRNTGVGI